MAVVSSHILDAVSGDHGAGIRVELYRLDDAHERAQLFDVIADAEGRISVTVDLDGTDSDYELVFHSADYFSTRTPAPQADRRPVRVVVVRLRMCDAEARYHVPLVLSPHAFTVWWPA